ncbi:MAG: hypothetical protein JWL77_2065 [Chthonomonadaceae bacterium]|nr:hypothetical protein [Chthonomonadaceae bacterium]
MYARNLLLLCFGVGLWLGMGVRTGAQISVRQPVSALPAETYSVRVENAQYGRIEISLDRGGHTILIGRVLRPAVQMATEKTATAPGTVLRAESDGVAFCVATGRVMKLLPAALPGKPARSAKKAPGPGPAAIVTDIARGKGLFGDLLPPSGTILGAISDTPREAPFQPDYLPALDDVFVFHVRLPLPAAKAGQTDAQREDALRESVRAQVTALQKEYAAGAIARARSAGRKVVSGTLTLRALVPESEPDPITAVTYMVDGRFIAAQNTAPFIYQWNTHNVEDGEHVLEIRAVNRNARLVTRVRALVVVQNNPASPATSAASTPPSPQSSP